MPAAIKPLTMLESNGVLGRYHGTRILFGKPRYRVKLAGGKWGYFNPEKTSIVFTYSKKAPANVGK